MGLVVPTLCQSLHSISEVAEQGMVGDPLVQRAHPKQAPSASVRGAFKGLSASKGRIRDGQITNKRLHQAAQPIAMKCDRREMMKGVKKNLVGMG